MKRRRPGISTFPNGFRVLRLATASLFAAAVLPAQTHKVAATERVTRAVAVYEWTGDLDKPKAARLVPVSLFINSRLEDACVYLARPVPFSLQTGDLYEIEKAGHNEGTFALDHARRVMPFADPNGESNGAWFAYGKFSPTKPAPKAPPLQASAHPPAITSSADPDRPKFANRSSDPGPSSKTSDKSSSPSDSSEPTLRRSATADQSSTDSDTKSADTKSSKDKKDDDLDRPTLRKRDPSDDAQRQKSVKPGQSGVTGPEVSLNDDPDRPHMRHGAPPGAESTAELTGLPADMHQVAAVSDAATRDAHIFAREWESPTERADTLARLEAIARPQVAAYITTNKLTPGTPTIPVPATATATAQITPAPAVAQPTPADDESGPTLKRGVPKEYQNQAAGKPIARPTTPSTRTTPGTHTTSAKKAGKPVSGPLLALEDEQIAPYTLSYGGLATFVYSAQASLITGGPVYVTVVAQRMVSGELQVALSSVTDAAHLDRTPWLRLVDAVDPDAGHRASLLFELRAQTTRQFALYRLTSSHAEQIFSTGAM